MFVLWVYLTGFAICMIAGTITAFVEKRRFNEDKISSTAWGSVILYSAWWPFIMFLNFICIPFDIIDKLKNR